MVLGDILVAHANDCGMKFNAHFLGKAVRSEGFYLDGCMLGEYNANGLLFKHEGFHCPSLVFEVKAQWPERQILNSIQQLVVHVRVLVVFVYIFIPDFGKLHPFLEAEGLSITVEDKTVNLDWCMPVKFDTNWMVLEEVGLVIKINRHAFELFGLWRWCRCHWSRSRSRSRSRSGSRGRSWSWSRLRCRCTFNWLLLWRGLWSWLRLLHYWFGGYRALGWCRRWSRLWFWFLLGPAAEH
mmetsp:Transcript_43300/g.79424  ORF Transcript_43300/g.79424 Transcript_43300/m.79424 type:complete len:239 (-) Transcript_43300:493-1209(-)